MSAPLSSMMARTTASNRVVPRPVRQQRRATLRPAAVAIRPPSGGDAYPSAAPRRLFSSLAAYADISAAVKGFEAATGRAAMVGVAVALCTELITDRGVFNSLHSFHDLTEYLALVGLGMSSAAGVAGAARNPLGLDLRAAVARSLTTLSSAEDGSRAGDFIDAALSSISTADLLSACGEDIDPEQQ